MSKSSNEAFWFAIVVLIPSVLITGVHIFAQSAMGVSSLGGLSKHVLDGIWLAFPLLLAAHMIKGERRWLSGRGLFAAVFAIPAYVAFAFLVVVFAVLG